MKLSKIRIAVGLPKPLRLLHISDTHLCYADERDDVRKRELAAQRRPCFEGPEEGRCLRNLDEAIRYAGENCDLLLHTGDLIDFVSCRNLELAREKLALVPNFVAAGNHEFSQYVGETFEDAAYKMRSMPQVQPAFGNDLHFAVRRLGGVRLIAVDNSYYHFDVGQLERLKAEVAGGEPILLLLHVPLHTPELHRKSVEFHPDRCAYLAGTPEEALATYSPERQRQQRPTPETTEFIEYVRNCPAVRAILAGHIHFTENDAGAFSPYAMQYVAGGGYYNCAEEFELI